MPRSSVYNPDDELNVHLGGKAQVGRAHTGWSGPRSTQRVVPAPTLYSQQSIVMVESVRRSAMMSGAKTTIVEHARYLQEEQEKNRGRGAARDEPDRAVFFSATEDRVRTHRDIALERQALDPSQTAEREALRREMNASWEMKWAGDRHHLRVIVSPKNGRQIDMVQHVRDLMGEAEKDQGTRLDWRAVIHRDTEHVHAQIIIRGKRDDGRTLYLDRAYISHGLRHRSQELATKELGLRHRDREMALAERAIEQERRLKLRDMAKQQSKGHDLTPSIGP